MRIYTYDSLNRYVSLIRITNPDEIHEELAASRIDTQWQNSLPQWARFLILGCITP